MNQRGKSIRALVLSSLMVVLAVSGVNIVSEEARAYTPHAPIKIVGNSGFNAANGVTGGSGTPLDPYIIEGWDINCSFDVGIDIVGTDAHFIIRDVYLHHGKRNHWAGVYFANLVNGRLESSIITNNHHGVRFSNATPTVVNNIISHNTLVGIGLALKGGVVENNTIYSNGDRGIRFDYSEDSIAIGNTVYDNQKGIEVFRSKNVTIVDNNISGSNEWGTAIWQSITVNVTGNTISSNKWEGIDFQGSSTVSVVDNTIYQNEDNGISTNGDQQITFTNNSIVSNDLHGMAVGFGDHVDVIGNIISSNGGDGILLGMTSTDVVADNDISMNGGFGMELESSTYITTWGNRFVQDDIIITGDALDHFNTHTITDNNTANDLPIYYYKNTNVVVVESVPLGELLIANCINVDAKNLTIANTDVGIEMAYVGRSNIDANNISSNNHYGIYLFSAFDTVLNENLISYNRNGISVDASTDLTLEHNAILSNDEYGVYVDSSVNTSLLDNYIVDNHHEIYFEYSINTNITHNYISGGMFGIRSRYSTFSNITRNLVQGNEYGIHSAYSDVANITFNDVTNNAKGTCLNVSTGIYVHHNNIVGNGIQAWDDNLNENFWNDSYPSGGNYWSDYVGADVQSGPGQNLSGGDGIGDQPYFFTDGNRNDTYPLMDLVELPIPPPSAPQNLQATSGEGEVTLTWEPPSFTDGFPVENYMVYRGTSAGSESFLVELTDVLDYTDTGSSNGQTYYYQVSAKTVGGEGEKSDEANATPATVPGPPAISDTKEADGQITVNWSAPDDDGGAPITNFRIYRGSSSGQETFLAETGNVSGFEDTGLTNGVTYFYLVAAVNRVGQGPNSTEVNATPENWAPACTIVDPSQGETVSGLYTFSGSASDSDGTVERVEIRFDDGNWIEITAVDYWIHAVDSTTLEEGEHTVYARAWDGDEYSPEVSVSFVVDNVEESTSIFSEIWLWLLIVVMIVAVVLAVLLYRRQRGRVPEEATSEEPEDETESAGETD